MRVLVSDKLAVEDISEAFDFRFGFALLLLLPLRDLDQQVMMQ